MRATAIAAAPGGTRLEAGSAVDRCPGLTWNAFLSRYLIPLKPAIVADAFDYWPARTRWTPTFFRDRYGSRLVTIDGVVYRFGDFIDLIERSTAARPAPYFRNVLIEQWAPELLDDILPLPRHTRPNWLDSGFFPERPSLTSIELYIGGAGAAFPTLHYDNLHTHAFLMQLFGTKEYVFYSPDQSDFLYPQQGTERNKSAVNDIANPDLKRFPLFVHATPSRCVLRAGEMLFVPAGWWHTARLLEPTITVSANTVNATNWGVFVRDYIDRVGRHRTRNRSAAIAAYVRLFGLIAWLVSRC